MPKAGHASLSIFDKDGRMLSSPVDEVVPAGKHSLSWNGMTANGMRVPAGTYFCRLNVDGAISTKEIVVVR
jgi:flagellar hook assembly protein FlgD